MPLIFYIELQYNFFFDKLESDEPTSLVKFVVVKSKRNVYSVLALFHIPQALLLSTCTVTFTEKYPKLFTDVELRARSFIRRSVLFFRLTPQYKHIHFKNLNSFHY